MPATAGVRLVRETVREFLDDDCPRMAAALSYYTVFSLPPLLVLLLSIAGAVLDPQDIRGVLESQIRSLVGPQGVQQVRTILDNASAPGSSGPLRTIVGVGALLFGATGAFAQLQASLNAAWEIKPDPTQGGVRNFFMKRVLSFAMILGIGFLLLVSLVLSTLLSAFGDFVAGLLPGEVSGGVLRAVHFGISFGTITLLFAAMFKILPDAVIRWRDVAVGAAVTALLFVLGKAVIGLYLGSSDFGDAYGAAGSLAVVLVWIYYSSMILLIGAEFTQVWARLHGVQIIPELGAVCARGQRASAEPKPRPLIRVLRRTR